MTHATLDSSRADADRHATAIAWRLHTEDPNGEQHSPRWRDLYMVFADPRIALIESVLESVAELEDASAWVLDRAAAILSEAMERWLLTPGGTRANQFLRGGSPTGFMYSRLRAYLLSGPLQQLQQQSRIETVDSDRVAGAATPQSPPAVLVDERRIRGPARERVRIGAKLLHEALHIPPLTPPPDRATRDLLATSVATHPFRVADSLAEVAAGVRDHHLSVLWAGFTEDDAASLLRRSDRVALVVVTAALSPRFQLRSREKAKMRATLMLASRVADWPGYATELLSAWEAEFCGRPLEVGEVPPPRRPAPAWGPIADAVARFPGAPLGTVDIAGRMAAILAAVRNHPND